MIVGRLKRLIDNIDDYALDDVSIDDDDDDDGTAAAAAALSRTANTSFSSFVTTI